MSFDREEIQVSIVVPVYNVKDELQTCVNSLISQTIDSIEIILVDDGSTDGSAELCDSFGRTDPRISVIHKENGGLSSARNAGIELARGAYIMFVDSDDYVDVDSCEVLCCLGEQFSADVVVADWVEEPLSTAVHYEHVEEGRLYSGTEYMQLTAKFNELYPCSCFAMYKRDFWTNYGLNFKEGILHEDMELMPKIYLNASSVVFVRKPFYHYVMREGSINHSHEDPRHKDSLQLIYSEWHTMFASIADPDFRKIMLGYLSKYYLYSIRTRNYQADFKVDGISHSFLVRNALNTRELIKALAFCIAPVLFCRMGRSRR